MSWDDIAEECERLARQGLGFEDILVRLRHLGVTRFQARWVVFGKAAARRMEDRDLGGDVPWRVRKARAS
jgi:hypothetical protein